MPPEVMASKGTVYTSPNEHMWATTNNIDERLADLREQLEDALRRRHEADQHATACEGAIRALSAARGHTDPDAPQAAPDPVPSPRFS